MSTALSTGTPTHAQTRREQERAANLAAAKRLAAALPDPTEAQLRKLRGLLRTGGQR